MNKHQRINALVCLGKSLSPNHENISEVKIRAFEQNPWFTEKNVHICLQNWHQNLSETNITKWLSDVPEINPSPKKVGIVMAGNIPLVGLHDLLCVIATGNMAIVKCSSKDEVLMKYAVGVLTNYNGDFSEYIIIQDSLKEVGAIIATGSDNTTRYFEYYFGKMPHIFRGNRTGVAVLHGDESKDQLNKLAGDVLTYFGLGCRSVTKLYLPVDYNVVKLIDAFEVYNFLKDHFKFSNNYTYHKAIFLMNLDKHLDNGFLLFKKDNSLHAPLGCLFYEHYSDQQALKTLLNEAKSQIQVIVGGNDIIDGIPFGTAQNTALTDYADEINTLDFLLNL